MAKVKSYDVTDVESRTFKQPTPGMYTAVIKEASIRDDDGKDDLEVVFSIVGTEFADSQLWDYVSFSEASAWKVKEFVDAVGLPPKGAIDPAKLINKKIKIKVNGDQYQGEYRARVGRYAPLDAGDSATAEAPAAAAVQEVQVDPDAAAPADAAQDTADAPYEEWSLNELMEAVNEDEVLKSKLPEGKEADQDYLVNFLYAADNNELDEWLTPPEEAPAETVDYATWSAAELKEEIGRRGLTVPNGRVPSSRLIAILQKADSDPEDVFKS